MPNVNDVMNRGMDGLLKVSAGTTQILGTGIGARVMMIHLGAGTDASDLDVYNAATAAGGTLIRLVAAPDGNDLIDFRPQGMLFDVAISVAATGTGVTWEIFYIDPA